MMPQFSEEKTYSLRADDLFVGLSWFIMGLAKKSILANKLAPTADYAFAHVSMLSPLKPGWAYSAMRSSCTSIFLATQIWPSASRACSPSASHELQLALQGS